MFGTCVYLFFLKKNPLHTFAFALVARFVALVSFIVSDGPSVRQDALVRSLCVPIIGIGTANFDNVFCSAT